MTIEIDRLVQQTATDQMSATVQWEAFLGISLAGASVEIIPYEIEMLLRNPAVYKDRIDSGIVYPPDEIIDRWNGLNDEAFLICNSARGRSVNNHSDPELNSIGDLQHLAFTKALPVSATGRLITFIDDSADLFKDSLPLDFGPESLLRYFSNNAKTALKGVSEAQSRLAYSENAATRVRNRQR